MSFLTAIKAILFVIPLDVSLPNHSEERSDEGSLRFLQIDPSPSALNDIFTALSFWPRSPLPVFLLPLSKEIIFNNDVYISNIEKNFSKSFLKISFSL